MSDLTPLVPEARSRQYETLLQVSCALATCRMQRQLLRNLADLLRPVVRFDLLGVVLHDAATNTYRRAAVHPRELESQMVPFVARHRPSAGTPLEVVVATRRPLVLATEDTAGRFPGTYEFARQHGFQKGCWLPLLTPRRMLGVLVLGSRRTADYAPADVDFLELVAGQVAVAVENAMLWHEARQSRVELRIQRDRFEACLGLSNLLVSTRSLGDLVGALSDFLQGTIPHDYATLTLWDGGAEGLRFYARTERGRQGVEVVNAQLNARTSLAGHVFLTGKPRVFRRAEIVQAFRDGKLRDIGLHALGAVPLETRHGRIGVLGLARKADRPFSRSEMQWLGRVAEPVAVDVESAAEYAAIQREREQLLREKEYLEDEIRLEHDFGEIVGESPLMRATLQQVETVAPTEATVLLEGETGTGKELLARAIHDISPRRARSFIRVNCAAIPRELLESELFGHERGAFTGAVRDKVGRFALANGGTLFLDEIGDLPLDLQPKLLRVLQAREFERVGGSRTERTDVRLVAATNLKLAEMVEQGTFRRDLFYRLNVFPIRLPPLRERPADIPLLVRHFVARCAVRLHRRIDDVPEPVMAALRRWPWPGNVRELENIIERAVILSKGHALEIPADALRSPDAAGAGGTSLADAEREAILRALREADGVVSGAAERLGLKRTTLQSKMRKLGIRRRGF
ncbi:MAG: sigma 54-interacting transcriptional regulator [Acidobacteriota bacterium]|nr:sigma 54-interacting transcriptional regulator [Acidobacteriota bacterium]